jgi:hypothetical protein
VKGTVNNPDKEDESGCGFNTGGPKKRARHGISIVEHVCSWLVDDGDV